LGKHRVYVAGDKIQNNDFMDYREYTLYADLVAAVAGYGAAEVGRNFLCIETGKYYYWNGGALVAYPSAGGAGAPIDASYVTINAEPALSGEIQHKNITGANLHICQEHHADHEDGGLGEISVAGLSGLLADEQNAGKIKAKLVDTPVAGDDLKFLQYNHGASKFQLTTLPAGGDMLKADYALDAVRVKLAVDSDTVDTLHASAFATTAHKNTHKTTGSDAFIVTDLLDGIARITVRKNTGADVGSRRRINFIEGTGISFTITDVGGSEEVTVRVDATGAGLGGTWSTGICSGRSPIVTPHSLGGVPTLVLASINAAQPYPSPCWTADATNITFRHAVTAGCTITFAARL
jgi:hypothetical protein